jgi:tRNA modification GTPase
VVFYEGFNSYTGEDVAEISIHSNPFIIEEILSIIFQNDAREALPGEFTYRAFKNGKIDLIQAESVNQLIHANSRNFAGIQFQGVDGKLSGLIKKLREHIVELGIRIETVIEFEEDQVLDTIHLREKLEEARSILEHILSHAGLNETLNKSIEVVIVGKVNVGKSSLFNSILMEDRAITSTLPGTTRDFIKERIYIDGSPLDIIDVAGIQSRILDEVEHQGILKGTEKIKTCDAVIFMLDASEMMDKSDFEIYELIRKKQRMVVANKIDIANTRALDEIESNFKEEEIFRVSVKNNQNLDSVFSFFKKLVRSIQDNQFLFSFTPRQSRLFRELKQSLDHIKERLAGGDGESQPVYHHTEIIAEEIRQALKVIGKLTGEVSTEEILQGIFSRFCVGK